MHWKRNIAFLCALILVSLLFATTAYGALTSNKVVASSGRILSANVGVYSDSGCTQAASSINWGNLAPGNNATFPLWIKNSGSSNLTLTMATTGWSPSNATQGITVNWDRQNTVLGSNQTVSATLTLIVSPSVDISISTFSFNTTITGTG
jgi:hypothetical protein